MSKTEARRLIVGFAVIVAIVMVIAAIAGIAEAGQQQETKQQESMLEPTRGLDIVSYDPPAWGKERISDCWEVEDRLNNRKYWLLKVDGQWVPLDIGEVQNLG